MVNRKVVSEYNTKAQCSQCFLYRYCLSYEDIWLRLEFGHSLELTLRFHGRICQPYVNRACSKLEAECRLLPTGLAEEIDMR